MLPSFPLLTVAFIKPFLSPESCFETELLQDKFILASVQQKFPLVTASELTVTSYKYSSLHSSPSTQ